MELLICLLIIVVCACFALRKPAVPGLEELTPPRPETIEDNSHLKADLIRAKEELSKAYSDLGRWDEKFNTLNESKTHISNENVRILNAHLQLQTAYDKVVSQKKSGEVRLGHVSEQLIPMLPEFPVPIETLKFFGNPIDYISIDMDKEMISFIEVKSGGSVLSDKQKKIRKMVQDKRIQFFEVRIDDKGVKVK